MDKYTGKRAVGGVGVAGRGSSLTFREASNHEDRSVQYCNLLGCRTRLNSMKSPQVSCSDRERYSSPFCSTNGKSMFGSSSNAYSAVNGLRKPHMESQNPSSHKETVSVETNNMQLEKDVSEPNPSTSLIRTGLFEPKDIEYGVLRGFAADTSDQVGNHNVTLRTRTPKQIVKQSGLGNQGLLLGSSSQHSFAPRTTSQATKPASHDQGANASRYGLRNLGCASISDVLPVSSSLSDSNRSRRTEMVKGRSSDGEFFAAKGKSMSGSSNGDNLGSNRNSFSGPSLSRSENTSYQPASRRTRYWPPSRDGITSVRTRRTINGDTRLPISEHGTHNTLSLSEPSVVVPPLPQTELSISQSNSSQLSLPEPAIRQNFSGRQESRNGNACDQLIADPEDGSARPFNGLSIDREAFRRYNMDGIAEVLLALERIEQDDEPTYEQLLALETSLFFGGLSFYDQHRDMRLDIDNMSYEELLALGEKIGTASTGLTEEELPNCLQRSNVFVPPKVGSMGHGDDDFKCIICQEEYAEGDEVGKLGCDHRFHVICIHHWLRLKNWCPICKAHAATS